MLTDLLTKGNDPIRALASYGQGMITAGWSIIGTYLALSTGAGEVKGIPLFGGVAGGGLSAGLHALAAVVYAVAGLLIVEGAFLAYYVPAIPFIFWTLATLDWVLMVLLAFIAAPLWAAAHAVPEGEGFAGRYALQGWQLFVGVLLRPSLQVIGLAFSLILMHVMCLFALDGYKFTNLSIVSSTSSISISGILFANFIMIGLVIVLSHKAHELIYGVADRKLDWIGFNSRSLGSSSGGAAQAESHFKHSGDTVKGAMEKLTNIATNRTNEKSKPERGGGNSNVTQAFDPTENGGADMQRPANIRGTRRNEEGSSE